MIKFKMASSWDEMMDMFLEAEPRLIREDIDFIEGEDEELVRKLAQKLKRSQEEVTGWVESVSSTAVKAS